MKTKKITSVLLTITMLVGIIATMPSVSANTATTFVYGGYTIEYNIDGNWGSGQNIRVTITNTGTETIENWMVSFDDFCGEIINPWNAKSAQTNCGVDYLRNMGYNANISPNESTSFGYTLNNPVGIPNSITMIQQRVEKTSGFTAELHINNAWDGAFNGEIVLTNTTENPIEWWELTFDSNFTITEIVSSWAATSTDNGGGNYTFKGTYTGIIQPYSNVVLGFQATMDGVPWIAAEKLTEVVAVVDFERENDGLSYTGVYELTITGFAGEPYENVVIPNEIDGIPVTVINAFAFENCEVIDTVTIPNTITDIGNGAFRNSGISELNFEPGDERMTMGLIAFQSTSELTEVAIPGRVDSVNMFAFHDSGLTSLTVEEGVRSIQLGAFADCPDLCRCPWH
jgi:hypothetical protein